MAFKVFVKDGHEDVTYSGVDYRDKSGKGTIFNVKLKDLGKEFLQEWAKACPDTCRKHLRIEGNIPAAVKDNQPGEALPVIPASEKKKKAEPAIEKATTTDTEKDTEQ